MEKRFHNKITWFTFGFSVLVIWVHSVNAELFLEEGQALNNLMAFQQFLGGTVAQIAVPGFFMISAYLFFRNFTMKKLPAKWSTRFRSILVPYVLWNLIYYLGYVIASRLPIVKDVVGREKVALSLAAACDAVLHYSCLNVFWYLHQLILLILLVPVIYLLMKKARAGAVFLAVFYLLAQGGVIIPVLNLDALLYYSSGAYAAMHLREWAEGEQTKEKTGWGLFLMAAALFLAGLPRPGGAFAQVTPRLLVPAALWLIVDAARIPEPFNFMKENFFLYAVHFAAARLINKTAAAILPGYWPVPLAIYLLMPVMVVWLSHRMSQVMRIYLPNMWVLLNGGRYVNG